MMSESTILSDVRTDIASTLSTNLQATFQQRKPYTPKETRPITKKTSKSPITKKTTKKTKKTKAVTDVAETIKATKRTKKTKVTKVVTDVVENTKATKKTKKTKATKKTKQIEEPLKIPDIIEQLFAESPSPPPPTKKVPKSIRTPPVTARVLDRAARAAQLPTLPSLDEILKEARRKSKETKATKKTKETKKTKKTKETKETKKTTKETKTTKKTIKETKKTKKTKATKKTTKETKKTTKKTKEKKETPDIVESLFEESPKETKPKTTIRKKPKATTLQVAKPSGDIRPDINKEEVVLPLPEDIRPPSPSPVQEPVRDIERLGRSRESLIEVESKAPIKINLPPSPRILLPLTPTRISPIELKRIEEGVPKEDVVQVTVKSLSSEMDENAKMVFSTIDFARLSFRKKKATASTKASYNLEELKGFAKKLNMLASLSKKQLILNIIDKAKSLGVAEAEKVNLDQ